MEQLFIIKGDEGYYLSPYEGYTLEREDAYIYTKEDIAYHLEDYKNWLLASNAKLIPTIPYNKEEK